MKIANNEKAIFIGYMLSDDTREYDTKSCSRDAFAFLEVIIINLLPLPSPLYEQIAFAKDPSCKEVFPPPWC